MNKTAIKNFAVRARRKLIEQVTQKAYEVGITKEIIMDIETFEGGFKVKDRENGSIFNYSPSQRNKLVERINARDFEQVMEEVAYTWFNRFIALRFMEINDYLPTGVRVLSSLEKGKKEPDIIKEALNIDLDVDQETVLSFKDINDSEGLYKYLLIKQCNQLGEIMPEVFEKIADYTEMLLPDNLLTEGSVIKDLVESIEEYDWKIELEEEEIKQEEEKGDHGIEIIGWLYQYYVSEKKDEVFANLKKNVKISKENIPAATSLFTPKWIVKYMVENSLGRLWLESHPDESLKTSWKYYLEEAEQESEVKEQLEELKNPNLIPEDIKFLDPAMGSGHILVYAFDVLYDIYLSAGYAEKDIPGFILEKNLYGLEIDDRSAQLATFALLMKARSKNRRILRQKPLLNLCSIQESNTLPKEAVEYLVNSEETEIEKYLHRGDVDHLIEKFKDAKEYGSILDVNEIDFDVLGKRIEELKNKGSADLFEYQYMEVILDVVPTLIKQAKIMSQKYDAVCTNPPYMGRRGMNPKLVKYLKEKYEDSSNDLFAVFMELGIGFLKKPGFLGMITQNSWMFLTGLEKIRNKIILNNTIYNMLHLGPHAFVEIGGEVVQSAAFSLRKVYINDYISNYVRLVDWNNAKRKEIKLLDAAANPNVDYSYTTKTKDFSKIPGSPIAYWVSSAIRSLFSKPKLHNYARACTGMQTGDNNRYVRLWYEIDKEKCNIFTGNDNWIKYNRGGDFKKWYGGYTSVVFWKENGNLIRKEKSSVIRNERYFFKEGITWKRIGTYKIGLKYLPRGFIFDQAGDSLFSKSKETFEYILGFFNTKVSQELFKLLSPTMNLTAGNINHFPIILTKNNCQFNSIKSKVDKLINISKTNWDSFETSWNFKIHFLFEHKNDAITVNEAFNNWSNFTDQQFNKLKQNEEELNRIFIDIYGLQDELTPEVDDKDITINKADRERDIKSFLSYAVGCMFGRYSLDEEGLIYAGGDFSEKYKLENGEWKVNTSEGWKESSIEIVGDNIIPITDSDYFEDDIVNRFINFLEITFSKETLQENLDYIAETLGQRNNETSKQTIRRYFLKDFYKNHVRTYKKRPIYWMFDSGKEDGFKALMYLHRYDSLTLARVRTDYLHNLQKKYEAEINHLDIIINSDAPQREKTEARKRREIVSRKLAECKNYDQALAHLANQKIELDLDDGVKVNYAKFQGIEIPRGEGQKPLKADLLAKI